MMLFTKHKKIFVSLYQIVKNDKTTQLHKYYGDLQVLKV
jgi:hypothetical protein